MTDCIWLYYYKFYNFVLFVKLKTSRNNIDSIKCQLVIETFEPNLPLCAKLLIRKYAFTLIYKNQNPINAQIVQFSSMRRKRNYSPNFIHTTLFSYTKRHQSILIQTKNKLILLVNTKNTNK